MSIPLPTPDDDGASIFPGPFLTWCAVEVDAGLRLLALLPWLRLLVLAGGAMLFRSMAGLQAY